jgi:hypothetical protein
MMPFEFLEPGVVRLTIPDTGWERSDRAALGVRGIHFPLVSSANRDEVIRAVLEHSRARRKSLSAPTGVQPRGEA